MTDCNGLRQFFEGEDVPTHIHQRMRQRLLRFMFTIVHRPARFMVECDVLTRYNNLTNQWRPKQEQTATPIAIGNQPIEPTASTKPRTLLAEISDGTRIIWAFNAGSTNIGTATESVGINAEITRIEERPQWRTKPFDKEHDDPKLTTIDQLETEMEEDETTDWIIAHDGSDEDCQAEREEQYQQLTKLIAIGERHKARAAIIFTSPTTDVDRRIGQLETSGWITLRAKVQANRYGATVATRYTMIVATKCIHTLRTFHMEGREATPLADILDPETEPTNPSIHMDTDITAMQREANQKPRDHNEPRVAAVIQRKGQATNNASWVTAWTPCYDTEHPGPDLHDVTNQWYECPFAVETTDRNHTSTVRGIRQHELIEISGFDEDSRHQMHQQLPELAIIQIRNTPPKQLMAAAIQGLYQAELKNRAHHVTATSNDTNGDPNKEDGSDGSNEDLRNALTCMLAVEFQQTIAIPLPTTAQWQDATADDADLNAIATAIRTNQELQRNQIQDATLYKQWRNNEFEEENGIVYHIGKGNPTKRRHVRTKVVPPRLRQAIFSALHASPMAGHTGFQKTYWKIAARYHWPNMATDIRALTLGCGHCNAANVASHEAQQQLHTFESDAPFDVITLDVWHPGKAAAVKKGNGTHVVTCIDAMTGFAAVTFVDALDSETMTRATFTAFFISHGLPKLVIIDSGSEFAGAVLTICQNIGLPTYTVSRGNHKAIICERFHKYMNKVQRIHAADCETFQDFMFGTIFAVYAWNSAPVDGTNIVRSYAAIGREFPFPIDFERDQSVQRNHEAQGQQTIDHVNNTFPLWRQQQAILQILVEERREHHRRLKNEGRNMKTFAPGDLVVIKKQVQTTQEKGPAKARMNARGPYRILEECKPGTYKLQKLPGVQGAGRRGKVMKESAARLTKIPSTLVIHKPTAGIDTRLATYRHAIVDNPLENILGLHEPGRYQQAEPGQPFAYNKIEDLWQEDVDNQAYQAESDSTDSDSDNDNDDHDSGDNDNGNADNAEHFNNTVNDDENEGQEEHDDRDNPGENADAENNDDAANNDDTVTGEGEHQQGQGPTEHARIQGGNTIETTKLTTPDKEKQKATVRNKRKQTGTTQRTSARTTKRPARYRQENQNSEIPQQARTTHAANTKQAHHLYKRVRKSRDKLFFIKHVIDTTNTMRWYVVQAKLHDDDTETTRNEGKYTVWFYIREQANSKIRQLRNCRYWPEIHQVKPNGALGPIVPIRPGRAETILKEQANKYRIYQQVINLLDDGLVGPFDFAIPNHYQQEANRIAFEEWEDLKSEAAKHALDVSDIEEVIPLR